MLGFRRLNQSLVRQYHVSRTLSARVLASDNIEAICGDVFKSRGHGK